MTQIWDDLGVHKLSGIIHKDKRLNEICPGRFKVMIVAR